MSYENVENYSGNRNGQNRGGTSEISVTQTFEDWKYDSKWITDKADKSLIDLVEKAGKYMADMKLTNSKIRNVYGEIKRIQMGTFEKEKPSFTCCAPRLRTL